MMAAARCLDDHLGPILYQLPPNFTVNLERLENFLKPLPLDTISVFEFRHPSWYTEQAYDLLDRYKVSFCAHDMQGCGSPRIALGPAAYVRFHGTNGRYWGRYPEETMRDWAQWALNQLSEGRSVWCFFNNDIDGHAIDDARTMKASLRTSKTESAANEDINKAHSFP